MDKLLKQAVDDNVVGFKDRFKGKMQGHFDSVHVDITKKVAANMAGVEPMEEEEDEKKCPPGQKWCPDKKKCIPVGDSKSDDDDDDDDK